MAAPPFSPNAWLRYDALCELLRRLPDASSFLEVGCGMGALAARLAERYDYVGYEPDAVSCETAARRVGGRGTIINDVLPPVPTRRFHIVGAFEVLEHQADDRASVEAWRGWIAPGGHIMLSVPADPGRFAAADAAVGHYRRYDRVSLAKLLAQSGFDEPTIWAYGFPLGYVLEFARNRLAAGGRHGSSDRERRTAASGRFHQPTERAAALTRLGTAPFRLLQRPFRETSLGTGLVAVARRSA